MGSLGDLGRIFATNGTRREIDGLRRDHQVEDNWEAIETAARRAGENPDRYALKVLVTWMLDHTDRHAWVRVFLAAVLIASTTSAAISSYTIATRPHPETRIIVVPDIPVAAREAP